MGKFDYEGKLSFAERLCYLLTGIISIPIGFALYFLFKDTKPEHAKFLKNGAEFGCGLVILGFIIKIIEIFIKG